MPRSRPEPIYRHDSTPRTGVLLVILMSNCLNLLGVTPYMQVVLKGAILVVAIWLDNRKQS